MRAATVKAMSSDALFILHGTVVHGRGVGKTLGYPTANFPVEEKNAPKRGVYVSRVILADGSSHPALTDLGVHPTFGTSDLLLAETHLLDWQEDLAGQEIMVELLSFLRGERAFDSADALIRQLRLDEAQTRAYFEKR